jgi:hypothetical protein
MDQEFVDNRRFMEHTGYSAHCVRVIRAYPSVFSVISVAEKRAWWLWHASR